MIPGPTSPTPDLRRDLQIISDQLYVSWLDAIDQRGGTDVAEHLADAHHHLMEARKALEPQPVRAESPKEHTHP
ncbi:MAG TPA: hypothetical protein PKD09_15875 [Aggregatilinea sp.]|uniref:hypothetical protein n=1 Tax=Aggregatilinea sp. TaxID=2806333 RepID=UPI002C150B61|nr:hypothetical protein [Aggregatilinea sp.]HML23132.1 hypothetical protein [Aggregatilinea sp.]